MSGMDRMKQQEIDRFYLLHYLLICTRLYRDKHHISLVGVLKARPLCLFECGEPKLICHGPSRNDTRVPQKVMFGGADKGKRRKAEEVFPTQSHP